MIEGAIVCREHDDSKNRNCQKSAGARDRVVDARGNADAIFGTEFMTAVVSGATVMAMPRPSTTIAGKKVFQ